MYSLDPVERETKGQKETKRANVAKPETAAASERPVQHTVTSAEKVSPAVPYPQMPYKIMAKRNIWPPVVVKI